MKIYSIKKFIRSLVLIFMIIMGLSLIITKSTLSHKEVEYKELYAENGDTLWGIASDLQDTNKYYEGKDVRYIMNDIMENNNLKTSSLSYNQKLVIPYI